MYQILPFGRIIFLKSYKEQFACAVLVEALDLEWTEIYILLMLLSHPSTFSLQRFILSPPSLISQPLQLLHKEAGRRLGSGTGGSDEIKNHKWFKSINWKRLEARQIQPSFRPNVAGKTCIANFDECWTNMPVLDSPAASPVAANSNFVGFSYVRPAPFLQKPSPLGWGILEKIDPGVRIFILSHLLVGRMRVDFYFWFHVWKILSSRHRDISDLTVTWSLCCAICSRTTAKSARPSDHVSMFNNCQNFLLKGHSYLLQICSAFDCPSSLMH